MLLDFGELHPHIGNRVKGVLHIGAHDCEEREFYHSIGLADEDIVWIDAIPSKVTQAKARGIPNVYNAIVSDEDDATVTFNVSNNHQSSSILEFGTHAQEYPHIVYVDKLEGKTITIDTFFERNNIDPSKFTFWNFDIQGAELMALKGAAKAIQYATAIYLEVSDVELYKGGPLIEELDAFLATYGFKRVLTKMTQHGWGDALYLIESQ